MSKKPLAVIFDKAYIPKHLVDYKMVKRKFTHMMYDDNACAKCPELHDRHSYICDNCPAYRGTVRTYKEITKNGIEYVGLPIGKKKDFLDYIAIDDWSELNVRDARYDTKFDYPIKFGGTKQGVLRDYQQVMCDEFLKKRYGLLESSPRSGKCVVKDTLIFTENGIVEIGSLFDDLQKNDTFTDFNTRVKSASGMRLSDLKYVDSVKETIRISTTRGYSIEGTPETSFIGIGFRLEL